MGVCVCVCVVLYSFITRADYVTTNPSRDTEQFHLPKDPLCYPFTSIPPRQPGQPLVRKWNHTVCTCFSLLALLSQSIINWGAYQNGNLFLTVLESGSPRSRLRQSQCLVRALFLAHRLLAVPSRGGRGGGALWGLFYKGPNLIHQSSALRT